VNNRYAFFASPFYYKGVIYTSPFLPPPPDHHWVKSKTPAGNTIYYVAPNLPLDLPKWQVKHTEES